MKRFVTDIKKLKNGCSVMLVNGNYYVRIGKWLATIDLSKRMKLEELDAKDIKILFRPNGKAIEENYLE